MENNELYVQMHPAVGLTLQVMVKRFCEESAFMDEDVFTVVEEFRGQLYHAIAEARDALPHSGVELHLTSIASAEHTSFSYSLDAETEFPAHIRAVIERVNTLLEDIGCRAFLVVNKKAADAIKTIRLTYRSAEEFHEKCKTLSEFLFMMHRFGLEPNQLSATFRATVCDLPLGKWTKIDYLKLLGAIFPQDSQYITSEIAKHKVKLETREKAVKNAEELTPDAWRQRLRQDIPAKDWAAVTRPGHATAFSRRLMDLYGVGLPKLVRILGINEADVKGSPLLDLIKFQELRKFI